MENKRKNIYIVIFFITTIVASAIAVYLGVKLNNSKKVVQDKVIGKNNHQEQETTKEITKNKKNDTSKGYVYNANYTSDVKPSSYKMEDGSIISIDNIVLPYININSDDAIKANKEIKNIYDEHVLLYKQLLGDKENSYLPIICTSYITFEKDNLISIVIEKPTNYYAYTYTFNLETLKQCTYQDVYKKLGFTDNNINQKVIFCITKRMEEEMQYMDGSQGDSFNKYLNETLENYNNSVKNNTIKYFIDDKNKLNIEVQFSIPAGVGIFNRILIVE
ncbi:MAG: hypothetical protein RSB67_03830 [Clostridia bacterium]